MHYVKCFVFCALRRSEQNAFYLPLSQVYNQLVFLDTSCDTYKVFSEIRSNDKKLFFRGVNDNIIFMHDYLAIN